MDIGEAALDAQVEWFAHLAARGCAQLSVAHGFAVSSGLTSNTENGAVVSPAILDRPAELDQLLTWLHDRTEAASVIVTGPLAPAAVAQLERRGLDPENTGNDMGRVLRTADTTGPIGSPEGIQVSEVTDSAALPDGFGVYQADGWWDEPEEFDRAVALACRLGFGPGQPIRHWVAHHERRLVGAATSFVFGDTVLLVRCLVVPESRRRGVGTALTRARLAAAAHDGARSAVLSPSPDGYQLHHALGFDLRSTPRNRWFYLDRSHRASTAPDTTA